MRDVRSKALWLLATARDLFKLFFPFLSRQNPHTGLRPFRALRTAVVNPSPPRRELPGSKPFLVFSLTAFLSIEVPRRFSSHSEQPLF